MKVIKSHVGANRYLFDFEVCSPSDGWVQYDTSQDAWYFGVWVHPEKREIVTFAEGDVSVETCESDDEYHAKLAEMADFYGSPPPAFTVYGLDGSVDHAYDERPT